MAEKKKKITQQEREKKKLKYTRVVCVCVCVMVVPKIETFMETILDEIIDSYKYIYIQMI